MSATTPATVAQLLLSYLKLEGSTVLFGIPGGAIMELMNELRHQRETFSYVICRHETGATFIADGYARVTGKLGVALVTSGPGATNALTGAINAQNCNVPLLVISGEVPQSYFGRGYLQEGVHGSLSIEGVYRHAVERSTLISSPSSFQTLFTQSLRTALSMPGRAVHVSLPNDVAKAALPAGLRLPEHPRNYRATPDVSNTPKVRQAFELITQAKRPLIFLGNGCRQALRGERLERFTAFVEKFAIPVMTTPNGKGIFPESHPLSLRNYGLAACEWPRHYIFPGYDALLVLGSSLGELATVTNDSWVPYDQRLLPDGPLIQIDLDQSVIARTFPVELGIVADIGTAVDDLFTFASQAEADEATVGERRSFIENLKAQHSPFRHPERRTSNETPVYTEAVMAIINELIPPETHLFIDCANSSGWGLHYITIDPPTQMHNALIMGPMGFGVCAVVGAKLGAPESTCIGIVGDGALMMQGGEISTAAQYKLGAIWVVLNDNDMAMVSQGMHTFLPDASDPDAWQGYYSVGQPDLCKFAEGLGADAYECNTAEEFRSAFTTALERSREGRPQALIVNISTAEGPPYYGVK